MPTPGRRRGLQIGRFVFAQGSSGALCVPSLNSFVLLKINSTAFHNVIMSSSTENSNVVLHLNGHVAIIQRGAGFISETVLVQASTRLTVYASRGMQHYHCVKALKWQCHS